MKSRMLKKIKTVCRAAGYDPSGCGKKEMLILKKPLDLDIHHQL